MASFYYYRNGQQVVGPISRDDIRALVASGTITRRTLIRKASSTEWRRAGDSPKLFPTSVQDNSSGEFKARATSHVESVIGVGASAIARGASVLGKVPSVLGNSEYLKSKGEDLKGKAKAAARAAALATEKTTLLTVSLPAAFGELGKHLWETRALEEQFPEQFKELGSLESQIDESRKKGAASPNGSGFADKAKGMAAKGMEFAKTQQLSMQVTGVQQALGKAAYETYYADAGPAGLIEPIDKLTARFKELDGLVGEQVAKAGGKKWLARGGAVLAGVLVLGVLAGRNGDTSSNQEGSTAAKASKASSSAKWSERYKYGWDLGVREGEGHLSRLNASQHPDWQGTILEQGSRTLRSYRKYLEDAETYGNESAADQWRGWVDGFLSVAKHLR